MFILTFNFVKLGKYIIYRKKSYLILELDINYNYNFVLFKTFQKQNALVLIKGLVKRKIR